MELKIQPVKKQSVEIIQGMIDAESYKNISRLSGIDSSNVQTYYY